MAINVLRGIAQQAISSGINKAAADIRSGLLDAINPKVAQNRSPSAQLNRTVGKYTTLAYSFPLDVLSMPGAGNQGHYMLFYIHQQQHAKIRAMASVADAEREAAIALQKAMTKGDVQYFEGPIYNQAGELMVPKGEVADDGMLAGMNWYVKGIDGQLPQ